MNKENIYLKPLQIEEAVQMAHEHEKDFRFIAGGTDVMVNKFQGNDLTHCLIDITGMQEMKHITRYGKNLKIGAAVSLDELMNNKEALTLLPWLKKTIGSIATPVLRKTATAGGNLLCENRCIYYNQSAWWREAAGNCLKCDGDICLATGGNKKCFSRFVSDLSVALISVNASVEVIEYGSSYVTLLEDIYTGDGLKPHHFKKTSLIKTINIPIQEETRLAFYKLRRRESIEFTSLSVAVSADKSGKIRVVLGGIDPKPIVVDGTIKEEPGIIIQQALRKSRIVDNDVFSRDYRRQMIRVYIENAWKELGI